MRALLLRISVLGALVVLGWITIANAQRGGDERDLSTDHPNPLRATTAAVPSAQPYPSSTELAASRPAAADPFGLQTQRNAGTAIPPASASVPAGPSRYAQTVVPASAEQPATGPALTSESSRPADNRFATRPDRMASRDTQRYPATSATEGQEPAPFKADPFATPASSTRGAKSDRAVFGASTDGSRPAEVAAEGEGTGQPGAKQLEGVQSPQLMIQKTAPKEIQVGKPATFQIAIRNTGQVPACEVEVRDVVPKGTNLISTTPQATRGTRGEVVWTLGTIRPGEESSVKMELMPTAEGEIGSVATVHFGADASARSVATRPQLVIATAGPSKVLIGDQAMLTITISNPGTGIATGVVLEEHIPAGLQHPAGSELEYQVGNLKPGESRKLELPMVAAKPGPASNLLHARGDGNLHAEDKLDLEVLAPQLDMVMEGPKRRYLERQATYNVSVTNPGTAPAKQVELIASLPPGLKFVSTNNAGYYEEATRTVRWRLEELPANETGSVELVTMPVAAGQHAIKLRSTAQRGLSVEKEQPVMVEGIAAILFQVADSVDPIEIGGQTTYEVHVVNQGSKAAANVRLAVLLPPEVQALSAEGPTRHMIESDRVVFDGLAQLTPKADTIYRVRVKAIKPGDLRVRFQLLTDDMQTPVTKEESTRVYADE